MSATITSPRSSASTRSKAITPEIASLIELAEQLPKLTKLGEELVAKEIAGRQNLESIHASKEENEKSIEASTQALKELQQPHRWPAEQRRQHSELTALESDLAHQIETLSNWIAGAEGFLAMDPTSREVIESFAGGRDRHLLARDAFGSRQHIDPSRWQVFLNEKRNEMAAWQTEREPLLVEHEQCVRELEALRNFYTAGLDLQPEG